jgi:peptidoglycan/LPS O-acetylase OafA/YrhL
MGHERFRNLDAMRGVCALTVVLFHCAGLFAPQLIFSHGYLAVDIFFILSGFVISHAYGARLAEGYGLRRFMRARILRLGPTYWAGTLLGIGMLATVAAFKPPATAHDPGTIAVIGAFSLLLIPQVVGAGAAFPPNPAAWSLFGEALANLAYGAWLHRLRTRTLALVTAVGWMACAIYSYSTPHGWLFGAGVEELPFLPLKAIPAFLAGVILYRLWQKGWLEELPKVSPVIVLVLWVIISRVPLYNATPTFDLAVVTVAGPALIALLVRAPQIAPRPFLWLGTVSYPLYASHQSLVLTAQRTPLFGFERGPNPLMATLIVAACVGLAWTIHRLVERPAPTLSAEASVAG